MHTHAVSRNIKLTALHTCTTNNRTISKNHVVNRAETKQFENRNSSCRRIHSVCWYVGHNSYRRTQCICGTKIHWRQNDWNSFEMSSGGATRCRRLTVKVNYYWEHYTYTRLRVHTSASTGVGVRESMHTCIFNFTDADAPPFRFMNCHSLLSSFTRSRFIQRLPFIFDKNIGLFSSSSPKLKIYFFRASPMMYVLETFLPACLCWVCVCVYVCASIVQKLKSLLLLSQRPKIRRT